MATNVMGVPMGDAGCSHARVAGGPGFIGAGVQAGGAGYQLRDLVHADDITAGIFTAWRSGVTGPLILGAGESVTVNDVAPAARGVTGAAIPAGHVQAGPGQVAAVTAEISAAQAVGYEPTYDLKSGLATVWPEFAGAEKAQ
jgi:UDP-glucose 4-epimerase